MCVCVCVCVCKLNCKCSYVQINKFISFHNIRNIHMHIIDILYVYLVYRYIYTYNSYLVSLDVKPLYTNIPNSEGIKAVKTSLDNFRRNTIATKVTTTFLSLILTLNNFVFNCKNYIQMTVCGIKTICTPSYANIFMDHFEKK